MKFPIIDLHCDLLLYLSLDSQRTACDPQMRCAIPQLYAGFVKVQTVAVFTQTGLDSVQQGLHQLQTYQQLCVDYSKDFIQFSKQKLSTSSKIALLMAFENASGFCNEEEPIEAGLQRLKQIIGQIARPLYISLTWNTENRFGGGALTKIGLKEDGKRLLEELHQQQIAVDLSHASDALAYEMIEYIEKRQLEIPLIASHSNARAIACVSRNLSDELALEIFHRGGLVGLNLCAKFIGETEESLTKHIAHWLELGGEDHIALGADFFYEPDLTLNDQNRKEVFFQNYQNSACYENLLSFLQKELHLKKGVLEKLGYQNALNFISKHSYQPHLELNSI